MITVTYKTKPEEKEIFKQLPNISFLNEIKTKEERIEILKNTEILITFFPDKELTKDELEILSKSTKLRLVQCILSGTDHIKKEWFGKAKIQGNSGAYAKIMVEHIFAFILFFAKNILTNHMKLKNGIYEMNTNNIFLNGKTIGILGVGGIGKEVARISKCFNMKVLGINTTGKIDDKNVDEIYTLENLEYVLKNSDIIVICLPLNEQTENLITYDKLNLMKKDGILINVGRGPIINQRDLYFFLKENPEFKCALDVWWQEPAFNQEFKIDYPFFELPNFIGSPHISALTKETFKIRTQYLVDKIKNIIGLLK